MDPLFSSFQISNFCVLLTCCCAIDISVYFKWGFLLSYYSVNVLFDKQLLKWENDNRSYKCCTRWVLNLLMCVCSMLYFDNIRNYYVYKYKSMFYTVVFACTFLKFILDLCGFDFNNVHNKFSILILKCLIIMSVLICQNN